MKRPPSEQQLSNCPALLPGQIDNKQTFLDSIIFADLILVSATTKEFMLRMLGAIGPLYNKFDEDLVDLASFDEEIDAG